jgi:putative membrane protein
MHSNKLKTAAIAALIALASAGSVHAQSSTTPADSTMSKKADAKSGVNASDEKLMTQLAQANMAEIAVAELAQTKSTNQQILKFSKQMIDDHTAAQKELAKLADAKHVTLPKETDAKHQAALKKMNTLNPAEFDREYIAQAAVADHEDAQKLVGKISTSANDADLKALGTKLKPTIDMHLKMAKEMKKS